MFKATLAVRLHELGKGATVAVKQTRNVISHADLMDFLEEMTIMKQVSDPHHRNVCD